MTQDEKIKVGISIGDLNGIGAEVVLKIFEDHRMLELCTPVIFANSKVLSFVKKHLGLDLKFQGISDAKQLIHEKINVVNVWKESVNIQFGEPDVAVGAYALKSLQAATKALKGQDIDVLVTAPINKNTIQSEEFHFPGHTDYLAQELEGDSLMFMVSENLRIGLLTDHIAVKDVGVTITPQLIEKKINSIYHSLEEDFRIRNPKIAVLGINPHSGDNGVIGMEDEDILKPTLLNMNNNGKLVYGPYSADSFFGSQNYKNFDAIVAAYHDQGLIPFKTLSFGKGVNYTAGLSRIRTSPDHGTAFEIAGKGEADPTSFKQAIFTAIKIYKNRQEYTELTKNTLKTQARRQGRKER